MKYPPPPLPVRRTGSGGAGPGSKGGLASALKLGPEQRIQRAIKAGNTLLRLHGLSYFVALGRNSRRLA